MLCVSILTYWFLVVTGPAPLVLGEYPTEAACFQAKAARTFTLDGRWAGGGR